MAARNAGLEREIIGHRFGSCVTVSPVGAGVDFTPDDVRTIQGLAQQVTGLRPELLGGGATVGELAWNRGQGRAARGGTWQRRLIYGDGELTGRRWAYLPYRAALTDGSARESSKPSLACHYHPGHPQVFDEILAWFPDMTPDALNRRVTPPAVDAQTITRLAANGHVIDEVTHADDGGRHQYNHRSLDQIDKPQIPAGFRCTTAAQTSPRPRCTRTPGIGRRSLLVLTRTSWRPRPTGPASTSCRKRPTAPWLRQQCRGSTN